MERFKPTSGYKVVVWRDNVGRYWELSPSTHHWYCFSWDEPFDDGKYDRRVNSVDAIEELAGPLTPIAVSNTEALLVEVIELRKRAAEADRCPYDCESCHAGELPEDWDEVET